MIKIVASDLDGTLLMPNHQIAPFTKETLHALHNSGIKFIFATGRHHVDVSGIREHVGIPAYMITSNGARVHDEKNNLIFSQNLESDLVTHIINMTKNDPALSIHIYADDDWFINQEDEELKEFHATGFTYQVFDTENPPISGVAKIFFTNQDHDYLTQLETRFNTEFNGQVNVSFSTPWCLEVMAKDVNKGEALKAVAKILGHNLENCIAFGDGMNDAEMLSMAGKGLVMATSHEKVKAALPDNEVIGANADEAVAHYLNELLLKKQSD